MDFFEIVLSIAALTILETVLGIDNLVLLSILTERLPENKRKKARQWGLTLAWVTRLLLLSVAMYLNKLTKPIFYSVSLRDIFLFAGGSFLIWKATEEIHQEVINEPLMEPITTNIKTKHTFQLIVLQIAIMDIIFSLDSVLTAIGLTPHFWVMATAISIAILIMLFASETASELISKYPTVKMLALSFLILIGMVLIADSFAFHVPRGYVYFAMGFSLGVEMLNIFKRSRKRRLK